MAKTIAPYGSWPSPIDAALVASHDGRPEYLGTVGEEVWWTEPRPEEGGRRALMRLPAGGGEARSVLPAPWNVRNRVIEYGGRPWAGATRTDDGPLVVFTHFADQRLYAVAPDSPEQKPWPLTPAAQLVPGGLRWCDPVVLPEGPAGPEVWCVLEEFTGEGPTDLRRVIAAVPLDGSAAEDRSVVRELTDDTSRFVTGPRLSSDGTRAAWLAWDHPAMPWDGTRVMTARVTDAGRFENVRTVAGGPEESVAQVEWAPDGALLLASDESGWWNLQRLDLDAAASDPAARRDLCPREEEFAAGLWRIGQTWFEPLDGGLIAALHGKGSMRLGILDPQTGELADTTGPWTEWADLATAGTRVIGVAAGPQTSYEVVEIDTRTGHSRVVAAHHKDAVDPAHYPQPQERTFTGPDGRDIHAQVYPPHHPGYEAPEGEAPPYAVWAHGGPTGRAPLVLDLEIAYFTSRGIGVVEVNYGGSTGYGREYRNRLREQWGVVDVEDCAAVARQLAAEGEADPARLAVRGGSAGGWTTAVSLTSPAAEGLYACGTISYPILDLTGWATDETHDFESQYLESLVGPLKSVPDRYRDRSPLHHADRISVPFLLLQGLDDVICPPVQCERFLAEVDGSRVPYAYLTFEGEGHGFRRAETIIRATESELALYVQTFGITRDDVPVLELDR
ncbi:dipeptidyl aminopeptidase/acylaminoacyl peptidase [Streptomyces sp. Amel2xB2]|uniref:LpqB family beta-propeller domain-containing protein n=1 Tax=Streptomyces sp. Amel2xB2 TaxID=1305829 RepID=UPI000DBA70D3|nr:prolyl oligopeptidase family serine peptidase [Streptomyces sp. Amel2xB2]RAJ69201.1 dipeptidyl aminopeptidase/acylaminoacyl peptidase [Streptomyces sp. Amel2xB2]